MNPTEALARIEALFTDDHWWATGEHKIRREVRAVLAQVQVQAEPVAFDRNKARNVFEERVRHETAKAVLDRVRENGWTPPAAVDALASEFGVES